MFFYSSIEQKIAGVMNCLFFVTLNRLGHSLTQLFADCLSIYTVKCIVLKLLVGPSFFTDRPN